MNSSFTSLSKNYNDLLNNYKTTFKNYLYSIRHPNKNSLQIIPNHLFLSDSIVKTSITSSINDCLLSCLKEESCSGANYFSNKQKCVLGKGNGNIISSSLSLKQESAIVSTSLKLSYDLKKLNQQLMDLNKKISEFYPMQQDLVLKNSNITVNNNKSLQKEYAILESEKEKINQIILEEQLLNNVNESSEIMVTQQYSNFIVYLLVVILILFLFIKFFFSSSSSSSFSSSSSSSSSSLKQRGGSKWK